MSDKSDKDVYVELDDLVRLKSEGQGFSFLPKQPIHSLLTGQKTSKLRGRGLNFEEIRNYLPGDDVRNIDWKVTARMRGEAHVRVYTEERDRPVLLLVDQRINMFFGSVRYMKSVTAAITAAISAWRVISVKDRVGALIFNDREIREIRPGGSVKSVMQILKAIVSFNRALKADEEERQNSAQLNKVMKQAARLMKHDALVVVISDMNGMDEVTQRLITRLSQHNDVMIAFVHDPMEKTLPTLDSLVMSDGDLQLMVKKNRRKLSEQYRQNFEEKYQDARHLLQSRSIPVIPVDTTIPPINQIRRALSLGRGGAA